MKVAIFAGVASAIMFIAGYSLRVSQDAGLQTCMANNTCIMQHKSVK